MSPLNYLCQGTGPLVQVMWHFNCTVYCLDLRASLPIPLNWASIGVYHIQHTLLFIPHPHLYMNFKHDKVKDYLNVFTWVNPYSRPIKNSHFPSPGLLGILSLGPRHIYSPTRLQVIMWMCLKTLQVLPVLKGQLLHYPRAFGVRLGSIFLVP